MKNVFLVSSYPNDEKKLSALKQTLKSIKRDDFDILLTTNYPINDQEVYDLIDYFIYDKSEVESFVELGHVVVRPNGLLDGWFMDGQGLRVGASFDNAHHYNLYRCVYTALSFLNSIGYDFFYYIEGDANIEKDEMDILLKFKDRMFEENKKMIFFEVDMWGRVDYSQVYGGVPKFFVEKTNIPYDYKTWLSGEYYLKGLEIIYYQCFHQYEEEMLILKWELLTSFKLNTISKSDTYGYKYILFFNLEEPYIVLYNHHSSETSRVELYLDDSLILNNHISPRCYYIQKIETSDILNKELKEKVYMNEVLEYITSKKLTDEKIELMKKSQILTFN
jgi:hypothetical protein